MKAIASWLTTWYILRALAGRLECCNRSDGACVCRGRWPRAYRADGVPFVRDIVPRHYARVHGNRNNENDECRGIVVGDIASYRHINIP